MRLNRSACNLLFSMILSAGFPAMAFATNYYISNTGSDNNSGRLQQQPWQSLKKLNEIAGTLAPGDSVFFKRGGVYHGSITLTRSGVQHHPIVFTAFGEGAAPVVSGLNSVTGWESIGSNTWQAPAAFAVHALNLVLLDGRPQRIGRYPNADATGGGYLIYENFNDDLSITDNQLDASTDWKGAEVVIRKNHWTAERCRVTSHQHHTIYYTHANGGINNIPEPSIYPGTKNFGYFFQNDPRTLDQYGEWYFDSSTHRLQMVFTPAGPGAHSIQVPVVDTLVNLGSLSYISFDQLAFEGAGLSAIYNRGGSGISITRCRFENMGAKAIHFWDTDHVLVENVSIRNVLSNAIQVRSGKKDDVTIRNCQITNTGMFLGMGSFFDDRDYKAIVVTAGKKILIENNHIDSVGLTGIQFQGSDVLVQHNVVNHFCCNLDDGAGIYTYLDASREQPGALFINRNIRENIILNGIGAGAGASGTNRAEGIYCDNGSMNIDITGNTIAFVSNKAFAFNNPFNINVRENTCYSNGMGWSASRRASWQSFSKLNINKNIFYAADPQQSQANFLYAGLKEPGKLSIWEAIKLVGDIDSNYYNMCNPFGFNYTFSEEEGKPLYNPSPLTLQHWQAFTGQDQHSQEPAVQVAPYTIKKITGHNLVANGGFEKNIDSVNVFGSNAKAKWESSVKINGDGCLRLVLNVAAPRNYVLVNGRAGVVTAGKQYILRFNTLGNSDCGMLRAYLRKTAAPYEMITVPQAKPYGSAIQQQEFLLEPTVSAEANYVIEVEKNNCTSYLDDISLQEADVMVNDEKDITRFEWNGTPAPVEIQLDHLYKGVDGKLYNGSLVLPPFTSKILTRTTGND